MGTMLLSHLHRCFDTRVLSIHPQSKYVRAFIDYDAATQFYGRACLNITSRPTVSSLTEKESPVLVGLIEGCITSVRSLAKVSPPSRPRSPRPPCPRAPSKIPLIPVGARKDHGNAQVDPSHMSVPCYPSRLSINS